MLRLAAVFGLLTIALSFDFGGTDEAEYESILREKGYPEDDIQQFLQVRSFQIGIRLRFYWAIRLSSAYAKLLKIDRLLFTGTQRCPSGSCC